MIRALGFDGAHLFDMIGGQGLDVAECLTNSIFLRKCHAEDGTIGSQMVDQRAPAQVLSGEGMNEEQRWPSTVSGSERQGPWPRVKDRRFDQDGSHFANGLGTK
jgi:hypothetical protein